MCRKSQLHLIIVILDSKLFQYILLPVRPNLRLLDAKYVHSKALKKSIRKKGSPRGSLSISVISIEARQGEL